MTLVFATHNAHKLQEVQLLLPAFVSLLSLEDIGCFEDIPETGETLEDNAKIKADFVTEQYGLDCFSDDTGLLIDALNGAPGVYSARYAGAQKNTQDNIAKVLAKLQGITHRAAHFKTAIHLNLKGQAYSFTGRVEGAITEKVLGAGGFGYDPIFQPAGYEKTFGQLPINTKNTISHRAKAFKKLGEFLKKKESS